MDVIRGTTPGKRRRRWWNRRPSLTIVGGPQVPVRSTRDDGFMLAMLGSLCLLTLVFAMFIGAWTGG